MDPGLVVTTYTAEEFFKILNDAAASSNAKKEEESRAAAHARRIQQEKIRRDPLDKFWSDCNVGMMAVGPTLAQQMYDVAGIKADTRRYTLPFVCIGLTPQDFFKLVQNTKNAYYIQHVEKALKTLEATTLSHVACPSSPPSCSSSTSHESLLPDN